MAIVLNSTITAVPTAVPSKTPVASIFKVCTTCVIIHTPLFTSSSAKNMLLFSRPLRATLSSHQIYVYPDPIPEFAIAETEKFRGELFRKLSNEIETYGDELHAVVNVCAEIFREFLHEEYGGPGTLLIEPFTDMLIALKEKKLPGAPFAARASLLWAQNYVDQDWEIWNSKQLM